MFDWEIRKSFFCYSLLTKSLGLVIILARHQVERCLCCLHTGNSDFLALKLTTLNHQGFFHQFWEKAPGQNWEKMIDLTSKLGGINEIEHNKGSK